MEKSDRYHLHQAIPLSSMTGHTRVTGPDVIHREEHDDTCTVFSQRMFDLDLNESKQTGQTQTAGHCRASGLNSPKCQHREKQKGSPAQAARLVRASSCCAEVAGLTPGQGTYKNQPMNAYISGTAHRCFSLSSPILPLPPSLFLSL